ncbi:MAG TPA: nucleotide pyrophosphohydrolase [Candidatus Dojkabacteria bacterium]|jgi:NTP pyrophosphatase (non-canonical NTP hydrolase)|nr:nucleotide pyrophosphohydrolase [Candidatus Dojkabacteria bacterium]
MAKKPDLNETIAAIEKFRTERDWKQFHNPKNLAIALMCEASEVAEHFMWQNMEESRAYIKDKKKLAELQTELADVAIYLLFLCQEAGVDLVQIINEKMELNSKKYPVEKSKGSALKYNKL